MHKPSQHCPVLDNALYSCKLCGLRPEVDTSSAGEDTPEMTKDKMGFHGHGLRSRRKRAFVNMARFVNLASRRIYSSRYFSILR